MDLVIGLGETGGPLFRVLKAAYKDTVGYDLKTGLTQKLYIKDPIAVMNICIPYSEGFIEDVRRYQEFYRPKLTIIHSTVPIGTTTEIPDAVHSPILGKHNNMDESIKKFDKWVGGKRSKDAALYLQGAGIKCRHVDTSEETELLKLMCLAKYGMSIAFAQYQKDLCDQYGISYDHVIAWDRNYNRHVAAELKRPILMPPGESIGGHCVVQNTNLLNRQHANPILEEILKYEPKERKTEKSHCNQACGIRGRNHCYSDIPLA